jgi:outer membrane protein OmpA-like peptidoglycan-associated protein
MAPRPDRIVGIPMTRLPFRTTSSEICVLGAMLLFFAGPGAAGEPFTRPAAAAAGAFVPGAGALEPDPLAQSRTPGWSAAGARWISYRDFWFGFGSARIDATDADKVADVASYLQQNPSHRLALDGAIGDADYSARRLDAVREALVAAGVPAYKIHTGVFGDPRLRRERRVEVLFSDGR